MKHRFLPIIVWFLVLLVLAGLGGCGTKSKAVITTVAQANDAAYTIGVLPSATAVSAAESALPKAKMKYYNSLPDAYLAVQQGKVDAFAFDRSLLQFAIGNGLTGVKVLDGTVGASDAVGIGISRKSEIPGLQAKINAFLAGLRKDGTLDDMFRRWVIEADATMPDIGKPQHPTLTLKVATSGTVQPFSYYKGSDLTGYDLELTRRLAFYLNAKIDLRIYDYDGFAAAAEAGTIDCILANLNATDERRRAMDFSDTLYKTETALLVRDRETIPNATANPETATYGITSVVAQDHLAKEYPKAKFSMFLSAADAMVALQNDKVDYVMTSRSTAGYMMKRDKALTVIRDNVVNEACYIAIAQGREELKKRINAVLNQFQSDGTLSEMNKRWTNDGPDYYRTVDIPKAAGKNGLLKVALSPDVPPICFIQDGQYVGINVELMERIAYKLGMTVEFSSMDFDALLPALQAGKVDLALSDINATNERKKLVDFTAPYFDNPQVLVSRKKAAATAVKSSRVPVETARLGVMVGSTNEPFAEAHYPQANIQKFNNYVDSSAALAAGKLDYAMMDYTTALRLIRSNRNLEIASDFLTDEKVCLGVNKNNPELYKKVSAAVDRLLADGSVDKMIAHWIRRDGSAYPAVAMPVKETAPAIKVAVISSREPTTFLLNGKYAGVDIELINKVLYELGYRAEYIDMEVAAIPAAIESGRADMTLGMYNTPERAKKILFTAPYLANPQVLLARKTTGPAEAVQGENFLNSLKQSFSRTFIAEKRWNLVLDGLKVTVLISICAGLLGSLLGFGICMLRRSKKRFASLPAAAFIRLIQGTPIVVLLMILYYVIFGKLDISAILVAIVGFAVNFGVYVSEMMRIGIDAVDQGQIEAAHALGFTKAETFWKITFPQAARHFLPVFKGEFISMVKMTSVVGYIAIQDLTKVSDIIRSRTLEAFFPLIATAVIYFLVANVLTMLLSRLEIRLDPKRRKRAVKGVVMQ